MTIYILINTQQELPNVLTPECISECPVTVSPLGLGVGWLSSGPRGLGTSRQRLQGRMTQDKSGACIQWLGLEQLSWAEWSSTEYLS